MIYSKNDKYYFFKYSIKILKIFIVWGIFYIMFALAIQSMSNILHGRDVFLGYSKYFEHFSLLDIYYAKGIIMYHLWYLVALFFTVPILYFTFKYNIINQVLIISLILNLIGVILSNFGFLQFYVTRDTLFLGIFYSTLRMFIKSNLEYIKEHLNKISKTKYCFIIIVLILMTVCESMIYKTKFCDSGTYYFSTIPLAFMIFGICVLNESIGKNSIFNKIGKNSLGIYVLHVALMWFTEIILNRLNIQEFVNTMILWQIIYTPLILILSYIFYNLLQCLKKKSIQYFYSILHFVSLKKKKSINE